VTCLLAARQYLLELAGMTNISTTSRKEESTFAGRRAHEGGPFWEEVGVRESPVFKGALDGQQHCDGN
jgi:hypothetical protein